MKWVVVDKTISSEGTTITYSAKGTEYRIQSRKRHIPHANGVGTWDHTTYFVMKDGKDIAEKATLQAAKAYVEQLEG